MVLRPNPLCRLYSWDTPSPTEVLTSSHLPHKNDSNVVFEVWLNFSSLKRILETHMFERLLCKLYKLKIFESLNFFTNFRNLWNVQSLRLGLQVWRNHFHKITIQLVLILKIRQSLFKTLVPNKIKLDYSLQIHYL